MKKYPDRFIWGAATSSYQIEGAWLLGGKGLSIWDAFCHTPGRIYQGQTGDIACDHYHRFREDVALMKAMGLQAYRFSIAWPRIQPLGYGKANAEGIAFYSALIDELLANGITPWVTLYHWDLPLTLQLEKDGWLNPEMPALFRAYADLCFEHFGDRVKNWITFNEPWVAAILGYGQGVFAPGRISNVEPYQAAHHLLLSHAQTVQLYRSKYREQSGRIGLANNCDWREPRTDSPADQDAAQRALEFFLGWFADPIFLGDYPQVMRERVKERLPVFSDQERDELKGSADFFGLNHYTTMLAQDSRGAKISQEVYGNGGLSEDQEVQLSTDPSWQKTEMGWSIVPWGIRKLLHWIDARYAHPAIVITENGCACPDVVDKGVVHDPLRIAYLSSYLGEVYNALSAGVDVRGYFLWSLMDNFEWASGFSKRFGLHYVDFATGARIGKDSAKWYSHVIRQNGIEWIEQK
ncbi:MAG: Beta-glucosidase A [bacterium ADurb.Bin478]|nr:MAG: Beta-glucosidase A [bacterium ADurb.Bin478]